MGSNLKQQKEEEMPLEFPAGIDVLDKRYNDPYVWMNREVKLYLFLEDAGAAYPGTGNALNGTAITFIGGLGNCTLAVEVGRGKSDLLDRGEGYILGYLDDIDASNFARAAGPSNSPGIRVIGKLREERAPGLPRFSGAEIRIDGGRDDHNTVSVWCGEHCFGIARGVHANGFFSWVKYRNDPPPEWKGFVGD